MSEKHNIKRIEFCGGIGVGKSTVAECFAGQFGFPIISEDYSTVPFWEDFYREPNLFGLEKDLSFLLAYGAEIVKRQNSNAGIVVCDFAFFQVLAYSALSKNLADQRVIEALYNRQIERFGEPALIVHLHCNPQTEIKRIRQRGRIQERAIDMNYLNNLNREIFENLGKLGHVPSISLSTEQLDIKTHPESAIALIMGQIKDRDEELFSYLPV